jgi:hypothetical protein
MRPLAYCRIGWGVVFLFVVVPAIFPPDGEGASWWRRLSGSPRDDVEGAPDVQMPCNAHSRHGCSCKTGCCLRNAAASAFGSTRLA